LVGKAQGLNISGADFTGSGQVVATPSERLGAEFHRQQIRRQPRMSPVAVGKGMNLHQPVMKPDGDLLGDVKMFLGYSLSFTNKY
jgi:hypothetical protein